MVTEIYDQTSDENCFEKKQTGINGIPNRVIHRTISTESISIPDIPMAVASVYAEPVDNTGLTRYNADGYYYLGRWGYNDYSPNIAADLYRAYTSTYVGETKYWSWGVGETISAISAYVSAFGGPVSAVIAILAFTSAGLLSYAQAVKLETLTFDYHYRVRISGVLYFTAMRNITYWKVNNSTTGISKYETKSFNYGFIPDNGEMCKAGIDAYYAK